jgi:hypothetical protein
MQSGVSSVGDKTGSFALPSMPSLPGMGKSLSLDAIIVTPPLSSLHSLSIHERLEQAREEAVTELEKKCAVSGVACAIVLLANQTIAASFFCNVLTHFRLESTLASCGSNLNKSFPLQPTPPLLPLQIDLAKVKLFSIFAKHRYATFY